MKNSSLQIKIDLMDRIDAVVRKLKRDDILVGIPASTGGRNDGSVSNAQLLAMNVLGSPANNIPPRDVMTTGILNANADIAAGFEKAATIELSGNLAAIDRIYEQVGTKAANSIKKAINDQNWPLMPSPAANATDNSIPAPSTLAARAAKGFKGTSSLIVTGQMRNAITYVVRTKGSK